MFPKDQNTVVKKIQLKPTEMVYHLIHVDASFFNLKPTDKLVYRMYNCQSFDIQHYAVHYIAY